MASQPKTRGTVSMAMPEAPFVVKRLGPDVVADWEERAAIIEEGYGVTRFEAEARATEIILNPKASTGG